MLRILVAIIAILALSDLVYLNLKLSRVYPPAGRPPAPECSLACQKQINDIVTQKLAALPTAITAPAAPTAKTSLIKTVSKPLRTVQYISVPGQGSTDSLKWTDLNGTEFNFSTNDYPDLTEAYFEANFRLLNGNGRSFVRLFDATAGIEVWGSEISATGQAFSSVSSGKLTIRPGTHLYRVQARSLTADTTIFNSGKIKLILLEKP